MILPILEVSDDQVEQPHSCSLTLNTQFEVTEFQSSDVPNTICWQTWLGLDQSTFDFWSDIL